ncbi:hypothetical protein GON26_20485 [Flavobacterium sp. GA093]|uniref:Uncharacterized protein n=1 Tax=Flavobacterium hydrocarbonoxydans TaxID=2683249 RepID=A0A6I4NQS4_9FLAO|nr:hypothetical protein [Flavobacterium hydrocarbonoxydans]MWB96746.1 hypothetical protein [Flavobacterium hydrocarbonoxydans]
MTRKERMQERNALVRKQFYELLAKNPKWRIDAIVDEVAKKSFLSSRTIDAIINYEGIYKDNPADSKRNAGQNKIV